MIGRVKANAKFFIKIYLVGGLRALFLILFHTHVNRDGADDRVLIVNLEAIGDMTVFTSVLKHYRAAFAGKKVYLLMKQGLGLEPYMKIFVDEVITLDYAKFARNPWYQYQTIAKLRQIGFGLAVANDHAAAEVMGKIIALSLDVRRTVAYEGFLLQFEKPFDSNMARSLSYIRSNLYPKFTELVPSFDREHAVAGGAGLTNVIGHYRTIYEAISLEGVAVPQDEASYATELPAVLSAEELGALKPSEPYAVINLGSSQAWKNWPAERFAEASGVFAEQGITAVLIGKKGEESLAESFKSRYHGKCVDLTGKLDIPMTVGLIRGARLVFSNDTAAVHIAIATGVPSLCILGGGHVGSISLYGYEGRNRWVYKKQACFLDNWQCVTSLGAGEVAPCIDAITTEEVSAALKELLAHLDLKENKKPFRTSFLSE
jgi:ADP-heptose:LPS heptosyltransferase